MESKYEAAQQIFGYTSAQNSQTQTPDVAAEQFPDCVLLFTFTPGALDKLSSQTLDGLGFLVVPP